MVGVWQSEKQGERQVGKAFTGYEGGIDGVCARVSSRWCQPVAST